MGYQSKARRVADISWSYDSGSVRFFRPYVVHKISSSAFKNTHGGTGTKLYGIRRGMLQRCNDKKAINYKNYGGRGITILWESFIEFRDDMEEAYKEGLTIERINNDGNYCKENCCWIPHREQQQNKRKK